MSEPSTADVLDNAADQLLFHGRSVQFVGPNGEMCIHNAIGAACSALHASYDANTVLALKARVGNIMEFNWDATDDEVFDLLRNTAKALREEAGAA